MLKDAYQRFGNVKAMAKALGVYYLTACQKMDEYGLERKRVIRIDWQEKLDTFNKTHGTDYDEAEIIRTVYKSMGGIHKTAAYFDVTYTAMRNKLIEHGIERNPRGGDNRS